MWRISAAESCRLFIEDKITSSAKSNVVFSHSELSALLLLNKKTAITTEACGSYRCEQVKSGLDSSREAFCRAFQSETTSVGE